MDNLDIKTVDGFGYEWHRFDQQKVPPNELNDIFSQYFRIFPYQLLNNQSVGFDLGCGSGRWAKIMADKVATLHCIDASCIALNIARENLKDKANCFFYHASVSAIPLEDNSMDFAYSLGVLHHVPDTLAGIKACVKKLKRGAPMLIYLYYAFDNRSKLFIYLWRISDMFRRTISKAPYTLRYWLSQTIAVIVYYPLAKTSLILEKYGFIVETFPLSAYRRRSFYTMRTDAFDRFGTRLEKRFTMNQIKEMMETAGLERIKFSDVPPYWCAVGYKK